MKDDTNEKIFAVAVDQKNGNKAWYNLEKKQLVWENKRMKFSDGVSSIVFHCCEDIIFWASNTEIHSWDGTSSSYDTLYSMSFFSNSEIRQITIDCIRDQIYWVKYDSFTKKAVVQRSDLSGKDVEPVLQNLPVAKGITIYYETYTLYVMTMLDGMLYSLPLKLLEDIPSTNPNQFPYVSTDLSAHFGSAIVVIWDIRVKNEMVYLADSANSQIRRYNIRRGPSSMENYGPESFFSPVTLDSYNKQYYDKDIKSSCNNYDTTPEPKMIFTTELPTTELPTTEGSLYETTVFENPTVKPDDSRNNTTPQSTTIPKACPSCPSSSCGCIAIFTAIKDLNIALDFFIKCILAINTNP